MSVPNVKSLEGLLTEIANKDSLGDDELETDFNSVFLQGKRAGRIQLARELLDEFFKDS